MLCHVEIGTKTSSKTDKRKIQGVSEISSPLKLFGIFSLQLALSLFA